MFATIYLPDFYLQAALRHQPELAGKPVGLLDDEEKKAVIIQLNRRAEELGVRSGMTPSQGLARSLDLVIKVRSPSQEKLLEEILLHFAAAAKFLRSTWTSPASNLASAFTLPSGWRLIISSAIFCASSGLWPEIFAAPRASNVFALAAGSVATCKYFS